MGGGARRRTLGCKKKSELTEPDKSTKGIDNNSAVNTYSNDSIGVDKPSINKNSVDNANIGSDKDSGTSIDKNDGKIDKPSVKKSSAAKSKAGVSNINKAKFEEDIKKEPMLQAILDTFDGELLN